jgi:hypothetical protein
MLQADNEHRRERRRQTLHGAKITYDHCRILIDAVIKNRSQYGAKLSMSEARQVPKRFFLYIESEKLLYPAELMWRRSAEVGLRFYDNPIDVKRSADPRHARFRFL